MPEGSPVVSNTSPILNLALIDRLDLLEAQHPIVTVPESVWEELTDGDDGLARITALRKRGALDVVSVETDELHVELRRELDAGEAAAITYAVRNDAALVLLDEREGRKAARRHGLPVTGVIGILLRAAAEGSIELETEMRRLRQAGFWIAEDLFEAALERNESE